MLTSCLASQLMRSKSQKRFVYYFKKWEKSAFKEVNRDIPRQVVEWMRILRQGFPNVASGMELHESAPVSPDADVQCSSSIAPAMIS